VLLITALAFPFSWDNELETRGLIPSMTVSQANITADISIEVMLYGYSAACTTQDGILKLGEFGDCSNRITTSYVDEKLAVTDRDNLLNTSYAEPTFSCYRQYIDDTQTPVCGLVWECQHCSVVSALGAFKFSFLEDLTYASVNN
jgi:hypothetical protein